ncbi:MAG TPA: hypothetical protein PKK99_06680, partial [Bacteroidia bacterium]|nr:hypothetical protein [Bacteroidia bacterium]
LNEAISWGWNYLTSRNSSLPKGNFKKFWKAQRHSPWKQGEMQLFILPDALWNYSIETLNI